MTRGGRCRQAAIRHSDVSHIDPHVARLDADLEGLQGLLATHHVEQLNAGRKVRPIDHLSGAHIEARAVERALYLAVLEQLAARQRREGMGATGLFGEKAEFLIFSQTLRWYSTIFCLPTSNGFILPTASSSARHTVWSGMAIPHRTKQTL